MPSYKLCYFEGRGHGEASRQILHLSGTPFEDHRISFQDWPALKSETPFGKLPVLHVDGKPLPQSFAIARYLAKQFGFAGNTPFEASWVDALGDQHKDYMTELNPIWTGWVEGDDENNNKIRKEVEPGIRKHFTLLEKKAEENGSNGHFVGNSLTWIDLVISDHMGIVDRYFPNILEAFPLVQSIRENIESIPKLKEWIDKRPDSIF